MSGLRCKVTIKILCNNCVIEDVKPPNFPLSIKAINQTANFLQSSTFWLNSHYDGGQQTSAVVVSRNFGYELLKRSPIIIHSSA